MKLFHFFSFPDINKELEAFDRMPDALLLDVRSPQEHSEGHIPLSVNIPSYELYRMGERSESKDVPVLVYCRSGARSRAAAQMLRAMGYRNARNIGGIEKYLGRIEQSSDNMAFRAVEAWNGV